MTTSLESAKTTTSTNARTKYRRRRGRKGTISFVIALIMLLLVVLLIAVVPLLPSYAPYKQSLIDSFIPPFTNSHHLLGTDQLGRDFLSRLSLAGRTSLTIALPAVAINMTMGIGLGLSAGYFGGRFENLVMGIADIQLALPVLLLLIALTSALGPSLTVLTVTIGLTSWVSYGRIARAIAMSVREREFVLAPMTQGASSIWVMRKHLLQVQAHFFLTLFPGIALFLLVAGLQFVSQRFTSERSVREGQLG
jgi:peptide/nickel transport system permease protein